MNEGREPPEPGQHGRPELKYCFSAVSRTGATSFASAIPYADRSEAGAPPRTPCCCHLEAVGFKGAPRFLGVDSQGREVLSYIPGTAVVEPYPDWALTDEALVSVAELLRAYHDAASTFDPSPYSWAPSPPDGFAGDIVTHNDVEARQRRLPRRSGSRAHRLRPRRPGSRAWDVACAARLWAPLRPDIHISDARRRRKFERFRLFVDSYGMNDSDRLKVAEGVGQNYKWFYHLIKTNAASGHAAFAELWSVKTRPRAELTMPVACREQAEPSRRARYQTN